MRLLYNYSLNHPNSKFSKEVKFPLHTFYKAKTLTKYYGH